MDKNDELALKIYIEMNCDGTIPWEPDGVYWYQEFASRLRAAWQGEPLFVIFDGPPSHESGRFIEVETEDGKSRNVGHWELYPGQPGLWRLGPLYAAPTGNESATPKVPEPAREGPESFAPTNSPLDAAATPSQPVLDNPWPLDIDGERYTPAPETAATDDYEDIARLMERRNCAIWAKMLRELVSVLAAAAKEIAELRAATPAAAKLEEWSRQVRITIRGIDGQAEMLVGPPPLSNWKAEEIVVGYKLNTGLWHRLLGLLACCPVSEGADTWRM
jgi:hypothetical protein